MTSASENLDWTISVEKYSRLQNTSVKWQPANVTHLGNISDIIGSIRDDFSQRQFGLDDISWKMQQTPRLQNMSTSKCYTSREYFGHDQQHTWWLQPGRIWIGRYQLKNAADSRTHQSSDNQQTLHILGIFRTWSTAYVMTSARENLLPSISHRPQRLEVGVKCYRHDDSKLPHVQR